MSTICCLAAARAARLPSLLQKLRGFSSNSDGARRVLEALKAIVDVKESTASIDEMKLKKLIFDLMGNHLVVDVDSIWKKILLENVPTEVSQTTWGEVAVVSTVIVNVLSIMRKRYLETIANEAGKLTVEELGKYLERKRYLETIANEVGKLTVEELRKYLERRRRGMKEAALEKKVGELLEKFDESGKYRGLHGVNEAAVETKLGKLLEKLDNLESSSTESLYQRVSARFEVGELVKVGDGPTAVKGYIAEIGITNVKLKMPDEDDECAFVDLPLSDFEGKVFRCKGKLSPTELLASKPSG